MVQSLSRPVLKFAFMQVQDHDVAQEIVQEAFTRAWVSPNTPRIEPEFRRWLYRAVSNLARDYHRRRVRLASLPVPTPRAIDPFDQVEQRASDQALRAALQALGLGERQAIYLRYFEDQSFAEIGRILGRPQVTVRVLVHRGLGKLRRQLGSEAPPGRVAV
jgi:RNA polymerase sigma-70 factor (ECF subfamily)